jgi:hypothetical protein
LLSLSTTPGIEKTKEKKSKALRQMALANAIEQ